MVGVAGFQDANLNRKQKTAPSAFTLIKWLSGPAPRHSISYPRHSKKLLNFIHPKRS